MDDRPGSPEIDVVGEGENSQTFRHRTERFYYESTSSGRTTSLRATNKNGANRLAANTNKEGKKAETVNLRVRNMGIITVKKEPESDEDREVSYSLSSLLEECDFDKTPRKRALKSPTSLAMAKAKSVESARQTGPAQGRPRQSLENVISSLKSARAVVGYHPKPPNRPLNVQSPVTPISMPSQIISAAPAPMLGSIIGPQIVDVRSLASVVRPSMTRVVQASRHDLSKPLNAGHQRRCVANSAATTPGLPVTQGLVSTAALGVATSTRTPGSQRQVSTIATSTFASGTKPVNIRFVLPANVPFNTDQFQQVLQATLASLSSQSKTIEPSQLQKAIQAALTSVTKSTVAFNPDQLQQAIHNSLAAVTGSVPVPQVPPTMLAPAAVYMPKGAQRQPLTIAPKPPLLPVQPTVMRVDTFFAVSNKPASGNAIGVTTEKQISSPASVTSPVTPGIEAVTKTIDSSPVVNTNSNKGLSQSHFTSARDALVKALQTNRLNSPASSAVSPPSASADLFDDDTFSSLPPTIEAPAPSSDLNTGNLNVTSNYSASLSRSVPQTSVASDKNPSSIVLDSQTYLGQNASPIPSGTQSNAGKCSYEDVPVQSDTRKSVTPMHLKSTTTPVMTSMASVANRPNPMLLSSAAPTCMPVSNTTSVNLQISVPVNISNTPVNSNSTKMKKPIAQESKPAPATGCGCCSNCKNNQSEDTYKCHFPGCEVLYNTLQGLRKHHYFHPNHRPQIPLDKATHSVDHFLPSELSNCHRNARLRELFKRLSNDEVKEHIMPRMTKSVSLSDLLEMKSARAQPSRGQPCISAFKMFSEFERFRKEVESRLLQLILLPQGRAGKNEKKEEVNDAPGAAKDSSTVEPAKQEKKDAPLQNTISSDQKPESSASQPSTAPSSSSGSSAPTKKTVETICIDSEAAGTNTSLVTESQKGGSTAVDNPSPSQGELPCTKAPCPGEDVKKTSDLSSVEKKPDEAVKDSSEGESVEGSKQSDLPVPSLEVGTEATDSTKSSDITEPSGDQPSGSEKPTEMTGSSATESVAKDSSPQPMETDEVQKKDASAADSEKPVAQSTDVIMVDAEEKTEPLSKEEELKQSDEEKVKASQDPCIEKIEIDTDTEVPNADTDKLKTEEEKQLLTAGSEETPKEQSEKTNLVSEENKGEADAVEKKDSVAAEKVEDKNIDAAKVVDKTATSSLPVKVPAVVNVEEHGNDSQIDSDKHKTGDVTEEKSGEEKITNTGSGTEQAPQVSAVTDKDEQGDVDNSKVADEGCKEASKENKSLESEVSKSSDKTDETNTQSMTQKEPQNPSAESSKVDASENGSSSAEVSSSNKAPFSAAADATPADSADAQNIAQNDDTPLCTELKEKIALITIGEDEDIDENNLLEFGLPYGIKWGKVVNKVQTLEARKIARKEKYSEQDMKQFIYGKPKDAATAVIGSDCHAHPSFFRAYVMPALLDKHIDDFGVFGKKLLSRLYLSRTKYVDVLRSSIGPELAKILGINIFPTFKRIMDTWEIVKMLPPGGTAKTPLVLAPMPEDRREVPDDEDEPVPADMTVVRTVNNVQNAVTRVNDSLKRPSPADSEQGDNNKKQRLDNPGVQKVKSQATSDKEAIQPSGTKNGQKADGIDSSGKKAQDDKSQSDGSKKEQTGLVENQKETTSASDTATSGTKENSAVSPNSTSAQEKQPSVGISSAGSASQNKPANSADHAYSKSAASIIPKKAMIYTGDASKKGASPLPLSSAKGSPLYLVPVEKLAPKLIEQFINQAKGDGVKTRSASSAKKPKQPKQGSQVFVLVPSSNPNGSPMIQTLTSEEQLKGSGDKKPLLLLPADKVPKSMASQSPTVRRKMVITMVSSSGTTSAAQSAAQCATTTSGASPGGQQNDSGSSVESVTTPIMTARGNNTDSSKTTATPSKEITSGDPKPAVESADTSVLNLVSVVSNTSTLNSLTKDDSSAEGTETGSSSVDQGDSTVSKESDSEVMKSPMCTEETLSVQSSESATTPTLKPVTPDPQSTTSATESVTHAPESNMSIDAKEKAQGGATSANASAIDSQDNGGLDILGSSLLPSDLTLDNLLKDITGDGSGSEANDMPPLDISEVISSFEDLPVESDSSPHDNIAATCTVESDSSSHDTVAATCTVESDSETRSSGQCSALDDDRNPNARRQSPRRTPTPSKSTPVSSLADVSSPNTSGGSREDSDTEDGSPPRKRRKAPMRTSAKSSPQVTSVRDKEVPGKGSPSKTKGRKQ